MYTRPAPGQDTADAPVIPPGETREITFVAGRAGTYYYWGAAPTTTALAQRRGTTRNFRARFVVDPRGGAPVPDRILLIGQWNIDAVGATPERRTRFVINGRSWPAHGAPYLSSWQDVRMRMINAGAAVHPCICTASISRSTAVASKRRDTVYPAGSFTAHGRSRNVWRPDSTFSLTWKPTRPGNWLFHCHDNVHLDYGGAP